MKCPRCKYKHSTYDDKTDKIVPAKMDVCVMCAYPIVDAMEDELVVHYCDKLFEYIDKFKRTDDRNYLYIAEAYFRVALEETKVEIPVRFEGSE